LTPFLEIVRLFASWPMNWPSEKNLPVYQSSHLTFRAQSFSLTRIEFRLFEQLLKSHGGFLDRQELLTCVWGPQVSVETRTVDSHMVRLRRKLQRLGAQAPTIETVWGLGYRVRITDAATDPSSRYFLITPYYTFRFLFSGTW
jgi:DNA-binding winged helix-turn-helix (wHTH) protein